MRRNKEVEDAQTLQHNHESEPRKNLISGKGKPSSSNSNDQDNPSKMNIAMVLRKGVRSCTKHPLSKFMSYSNLSSSFAAFTSRLSCVEVPKNIQEALKVPKWKEAFLEEMRALEKNHTWSVMPLGLE